jgi:hypothetical protein
MSTLSPLDMRLAVITTLTEDELRAVAQFFAGYDPEGFTEAVEVAGVDPA